MLKKVTIVGWIDKFYLYKKLKWDSYFQNTISPKQATINLPRSIWKLFDNKYITEKNNVKVKITIEVVNSSSKISVINVESHE